MRFSMLNQSFRLRFSGLMPVCHFWILCTFVSSTSFSRVYSAKLFFKRDLLKIIPININVDKTMTTLFWLRKEFLCCFLSLKKVHTVCMRIIFTSIWQSIKLGRTAIVVLLAYVTTVYKVIHVRKIFLVLFLTTLLFA